jgi:hypothetical protein
MRMSFINVKSNFKIKFSLVRIVSGRKNEEEKD